VAALRLTPPLAAALALLLAACGQKGPLYLPGAQKTPVTPNSSAPAPINIAPQATPLAPGTALDPQPVPAKPAPTPSPDSQKQQQEQQQQQQPPHTPASSTDNSPAA
jgi:predicted small lipoprotein YifL